MLEIMNLKKLAIVGCGKLAKIVVDALTDGLLPEYQLVGTYSRSREKATHLAGLIQEEKTGYSCTACHSIEELLEKKPDYIVEAASPAALRQWALAALKNKSSIITLSIGAFADRAFYEEVKKVAEEYGSRIYIASGAIGGFDILRTAALMGKCTASIDTEKGPRSLRGTSVYEEELQHEKREVFSGDGKEAIALFPTKVNVAVAASLASVGPDHMKVSVTSTPGYVGDDHRIEIRNDQVHAVVDVYSETSEVAGWSVVATLQNISSPVVF